MAERLRRSDRRVIGALLLAGPVGAHAIDLMTATGLGSGRLYPSLARLHERNLVKTEKVGGRTLFVHNPPSAAGGTQ